MFICDNQFRLFTSALYYGDELGIEMYELYMSKDIYFTYMTAVPI